MLDVYPAQIGILLYFYTFVAPLAPVIGGALMTIDLPHFQTSAILHHALPYALVVALLLWFSGKDNQRVNEISRNRVALWSIMVFTIFPLIKPVVIAGSVAAQTQLYAIDFNTTWFACVIGTVLVSLNKLRENTNISRRLIVIAILGGLSLVNLVIVGPNLHLAIRVDGFNKISPPTILSILQSLCAIWCLVTVSQTKKEANS